jgi:hypothetical protein
MMVCYKYSAVFVSAMGRFTAIALPVLASTIVFKWFPDCGGFHRFMVTLHPMWAMKDFFATFVTRNFEIVSRSKFVYRIPYDTL